MTVGIRDPFRDPLVAGIRTKTFANGAPSIASLEGIWRVLNSALVFPPPSQAGRRGFESHRPLYKLLKYNHLLAAPTRVSGAVSPFFTGPEQDPG